MWKYIEKGNLLTFSSTTIQQYQIIKAMEVFENWKDQGRFLLSQKCMDLTRFLIQTMDCTHNILYAKQIYHFPQTFVFFKKCYLIYYKLQTEMMFHEKNSGLTGCRMLILQKYNHNTITEDIDLSILPFPSHNSSNKIKLFYLTCYFLLVNNTFKYIFLIFKFTIKK